MSSQLQLSPAYYDNYKRHRAACHARLCPFKYHLAAPQAAQCASTQPESTPNWDEQEESCHSHYAALDVLMEALGAAFRVPSRLAAAMQPSPIELLQLSVGSKDQQSREAEAGVRSHKHGGNHHVPMLCQPAPGWPSRYDPTLN